MFHIVLTAALLAVAVAQTQTDEQFQQMLLQKFPNNRLITGANSQRGMEAALRAKRFVEEQGCKKRICFALDAGVLVSQDEYNFQVDFVQLLATIGGSDEDFSAAAVQYRFRRTRISGLTNNIAQFISDVAASTTGGEWTRQRRRQNPTWRRRSRDGFKSALEFCTRQLNRGGGVNANKIVFLGDLRTPRGGAAVAKQFLNGNGAICAVGFGEGNEAKLERFTSDPDKVFDEQGVFGVLNVFDELVGDVCGPTDPAKVNSVFTDTPVE